MATTKSKTESNGLRYAIVCTKHKGVFVGWIPADAKSTDESIHVKDCRMPIRWGTTRGLLQLAETGPTSSSKISAKADVDVNAITGIFEVSAEARKAWEAVK